jgi:uncharacterized protein
MGLELLDDPSYFRKIALAWEPLMWGERLRCVSQTETIIMEENIMRTKFFLLVIVILMAALISACGGVAYAQTPQPELTAPQRTITVTGSGKTSLTPDIAYISIGVHTENKDAAEAVAANNSQTQKVLEALKSFNIDPKDIQTTNFSIYPRQDYDQEGKPTGITFVVDNTVYVTLRDIEKIGDLLDAAVKAGANSISGIQFDVENKTEALSAAREAAVADAQAQAEELAQAAGVELGPVQSINSYSNYPVPIEQPRAAVMMDSAAASVPISPGQMTVTVDVNMVFLIQ